MSDRKSNQGSRDERSYWSERRRDDDFDKNEGETKRREEEREREENSESLRKKEIDERQREQDREEYRQMMRPMISPAQEKKEKDLFFTDWNLKDKRIRHSETQIDNEKSHAEQIRHFNEPVKNFLENKKMMERKPRLSNQEKDVMRTKMDENIRKFKKVDDIFKRDLIFDLKEYPETEILFHNHLNIQDISFQEFKSIFEEEKKYGQNIKFGCIYTIKNRINGKLYVGQTTRDPLRRYQEHINDAFNGKVACIHLHNAIKKKGIENFCFQPIIIVKSTSSTFLNSFERYYIRFFKTINREIGYNINEGGGSTLRWTDEQEELYHRIISKGPIPSTPDTDNILRTLLRKDLVIKSDEPINRTYWYYFDNDNHKKFLEIASKTQLTPQEQGIYDLIMKEGIISQEELGKHSSADDLIVSTRRDQEKGRYWKTNDQEIRTKNTLRLHVYKILEKSNIAKSLLENESLVSSDLIKKYIPRLKSIEIGPQNHYKVYYYVLGTEKVINNKKILVTEENIKELVANNLYNPPEDKWPKNPEIKKKFIANWYKMQQRDLAFKTMNDEQIEEIRSNMFPRAFIDYVNNNESEFMKLHWTEIMRKKDTFLDTD